ncbi:MAG TPA: Wzz/FepE/Etk N-terminal domain-containing protein [Gammaproteobacteria bacterium]|nr:Wzz/FepE/Etk N-terminal domain-containing protein [Gammaproteobacteria bacterium]
MPEREADRREFQDDEIDLADLVGVLYKRRWSILGGTLLVTVLGLATTLLLPKAYDYQSIVEIGQFQNNEGEYRFVESPQVAADRLQAAARTAYQRRRAEQDSPALLFSVKEDLSIEAPKEGGILEIALTAPRDVDAGRFLEKVIGILVADHNRVLEVQRQKFEQATQTFQAKLTELRESVKSHKRRLARLHEEKAYLKEQIGESNQRIGELLETKAAANIQAANEPVGLLLFSSEIQRMRTYIEDLQTRLLSKVPEKEERTRLELEEMQSKIAATRAELKSQRIALENMAGTRILLAPTASASPVSPNIRLTGALAFVLGLFASVFGAFLAEFWRNNRARITREE